VIDTALYLIVAESLTQILGSSRRISPTLSIGISRGHLFPLMQITGVQSPFFLSKSMLISPTFPRKIHPSVHQPGSQNPFHPSSPPTPSRSTHRRSRRGPSRTQSVLRLPILHFARLQLLHSPALAARPRSLPSEVLRCENFTCAPDVRTAVVGFGPRALRSSVDWDVFDERSAASLGGRSFEGANHGAVAPAAERRAD